MKSARHARRRDDLFTGLSYHTCQCSEERAAFRREPDPFFPKDVSLLWFSKPDVREKLRKSASNDLLRLTVREPGPDKHEPHRNDRTVLQKLRTGPQVSPNTSPDEPARAHLDSCGRRAGASPHRPQPPSRAQGSSEEYPRVHALTPIKCAAEHTANFR